MRKRIPLTPEANNDNKPQRVYKSKSEPRAASDRPVRSRSTEGGSYSDRSAAPRKPRTDGNRPARFDNDRSERPSRGRSSEGSSYGDRSASPRKPRFDSDRPARFDNDRSERPSRGRSAEGGSYGERSASPRKPRTDGDRPARFDNDRSERPSRGRSAEGGSYGDRSGAPRKPRFDSDRPARFDNDRSERPSRGRSSEGSSYGDRSGAPRKPRFDSDRPARFDNDRSERPSRGRSAEGGSYGDRSAAPRKPRTAGDRPARFDNDRSDRPARTRNMEGGSYNERSAAPRKPRTDGDGDRPLSRSARSGPRATAGHAKSSFKKTGPKEKKTSGPKQQAGNFFTQNFGIDKPISKKQRITAADDAYFERVAEKLRFQDEQRMSDREQFNNEVPEHEVMPLNKFLAHAGVSGRREAADIVKSGRVTVNGEGITEPGYKVQAQDIIKLDGKQLQRQGKLVYILLNKPKDYITTNEDDKGRKTVLDLVQDTGADRIYPVGRLDRNTSGLILLTNDGELAQKLSHPRYHVQKLYQVNLDKPLSKEHFKEIMAGLELEDGVTQVDELAYADAADHSKVGIQIHSGKNRIVRRIFESLGYEVKQLDRVMYANLTKKNLPRGKWRFLNATEVRYLKHFKH